MWNLLIYSGILVNVIICSFYVFFFNDKKNCCEHVDIFLKGDWSYFFVIYKVKSFLCFKSFIIMFFIQTGRQTNKLADKQTDRQRQTDRQTNKQTDIHTDRQTDAWRLFWHLSKSKGFKTFQKVFKKISFNDFKMSKN